MNTSLISTKYFLFYFFLFFIVFFTGFDNYVIWHRTFLPNHQYTFVDYLQYFGSIVAVWAGAFVFFNKSAEKYSTKIMLPFSLLLASFSSWAQYRIGTQNTIDMTSGLIIHNMIFNFSLGFLAATQKKIFKTLSQAQSLKNGMTFTALISLTTIVLCSVLTNKNLNHYFAVNTVIYYLAFIYFKFLFPSEGELIKNYNELTSRTAVGFSFLIICFISWMIHQGLFNWVESIFDNSKFVFIFFLLFLLYKLSWKRVVVVAFFILIALPWLMV